MSTQLAETYPPRIGLFQAAGAAVTAFGTLAFKTTEAIVINSETVLEVSRMGNILARTGTKYAEQFEAEASIALAKKRAELESEEKL